MGMQFKSGFDFHYKDEFDFTANLEIPSSCSFSQGCTLQTSNRFTRDYSNTSQSIVRCIRPQAKTYSISYNLYYPETVDIFTAISEIDGCVGKTGEMFFCGVSFGLCIILSASIALNVDSANGVSGASVSLQVAQGKEPTKQAKYNISTNNLSNEG